MSHVFLHKLVKGFHGKQALTQTLCRSASVRSKNTENQRCNDFIVKPHNGKDVRIWFWELGFPSSRVASGNSKISLSLDESICIIENNC